MNKEITINRMNFCREILISMHWAAVKGETKCQIDVPSTIRQDDIEYLFDRFHKEQIKATIITEGEKRILKLLW